jgi:hypothetical protein
VSFDAVEPLLAELERSAPPRVVERVRELLALVLALHKEGLEAALGLLAEEPALIDALARDARVASLLLLHDLHPLPPEVRLREALEGSGAELSFAAGRAEVTVTRGSRAHVEELCRAAAPDVDDLVVVDAPKLVQLRTRGEA